jgi:DNA-binding transcriptional ArsR family regulator
VFEFELTAEDIAQTRLAGSPLFEAVASLVALRDPGAHAIHLPWVEQARPRLADLDLRLLEALVPINGYVPDFLTPPPAAPLPDFAGELRRMRATPPEQVRRELRFVHPRGVPALLRPLRDDPAAELPRVAGLMRAYWDRVLAPHWPRMRALLESDILHRARRLADGGTAALLADLHPTVARRGDVLQVSSRHDEVVALDGRGLLLMPSLFVWPQVRAVVDPPWQPTVIYPARGVGTLWEPAHSTPPAALAGVLGRTRAALLAELDVPRSGGELARQLELTPGAISQALTSLRAAGLVVADREGRIVLCRRTAVGDALLSAGAAPHGLAPSVTMEG